MFLKFAVMDEVSPVWHLPAIEKNSKPQIITCLI